jgi:hypothetical protein
MRAGEVDQDMLRKLGMTEAEFKDFVKKYRRKYGKVREMLDETEAADRRRGQTVRGGTTEVQQGRAADDEITSAGGEDLSPDEIRKLYESRKGKLSPEYRKQVEAYFRAIAEGLGEESSAKETDTDTPDDE